MFHNQNLAVSSSQTWNSGTRHPGSPSGHPPCAPHHVQAEQLYLRELRGMEASARVRREQSIATWWPSAWTLDMSTSVQLSTLESQTHVGKTVSRCVKAPLVEFHQRLKDTACSEQFHLFCKKRDPSFSHLLLFCAFGAAFGVQAFCQPTWQEMHGPEHEETRASRRNLERFHCQDKLGISTVLVPQFPSYCDGKSWPGVFFHCQGFPFLGSKWRSF